MRISSQQVFDSSLQSIQQHTSDVVETQRQISSGQKYRLASDDALAAGLGVQVAWNKSQYAMFKVNQDHINASLTSTDAQLSSINIALTKFQQMMVQGRNDPLGSDGRKILGQQAESLIAAVTQFSNAKDANGQNILRSGPVSTVLIAPSVSLESGISYNEVMMGPVGTGKDVLAIMTSIKVKLAGGNSPSDEDMVNFQAALTQVTRAQVKTGLLQNQLDAATESAEVQKTNVELQRSNLLDTDLATATASLVKSNALLQAAQSVMTKLDVNTLFQKL
ncbi:flagellin [Limnohabitans sp. Rim11]|jgi:flagellin-like hook-associated protein FlgL|uniref:flagellin n=1 Tax=Limnohabitans sp. Rim11 TaxID=1100719 RepID=UPI000A713595|nr:flagellin [Limnohabitans sp. Rim11]